MSLKRFPIVNIMFHVRSIDRIGNETHRISEFLKNIIQKLSYIRTAFRVRWRKDERSTIVHSSSRIVHTWDSTSNMCTTYTNAGNSFTCNSKHSFFKFDVQVGWTNIILLSFHLQTYCIRKKVSEWGIKYLNKFNSITNNGK